MESQGGASLLEGALGLDMASCRAAVVPGLVGGTES